MQSDLAKTSAMLLDQHVKEWLRPLESKEQEVLSFESAADRLHRCLKSLAEGGSKDDLRVPLRTLRDEISKRWFMSPDGQKRQRVEPLFALYDYLETKAQEDIANDTDKGAAYEILSALGYRYTRLCIGETWEAFPHLKALALQRVYKYWKQEEARQMKQQGGGSTPNSGRRLSRQFSRKANSEPSWRNVLDAIYKAPGPKLAHLLHAYVDDDWKRTHVVVGEGIKEANGNGVTNNSISRTSSEVSGAQDKPLPDISLLDLDSDISSNIRDNTSETGENRPPLGVPLAGSPTKGGLNPAPVADPFQVRAANKAFTQHGGMATLPPPSLSGADSGFESHAFTTGGIPTNTQHTHKPNNIDALGFESHADFSTAPVLPPNATQSGFVSETAPFPAAFPPVNTQNLQPYNSLGSDYEFASSTPASVIRGTPFMQSETSPFGTPQVPPSPAWANTPVSPYGTASPAFSAHSGSTSTMFTPSATTPGRATSLETHAFDPFQLQSQSSLGHTPLARASTGGSSSLNFNANPSWNATVPVDSTEFHDLSPLPRPNTIPTPPPGMRA